MSIHKYIYIFRYIDRVIEYETYALAIRASETKTMDDQFMIT